MISKLVRYLSLLAMVSLIASAVQAPPIMGSLTAQADVVIAINNGSFEEGTGLATATADGPFPAKPSGYATYNVVEYFDIFHNTVVPGAVSGNLNSATNQPTGRNGRPKDWTYTGSLVNDNIATDSRWNGVWNAYDAGPTDGFTAIILDNRSSQAANNTAAEIFMKQTLSQNVGQLKALGSSLRMDFDARLGTGAGGSVGTGGNAFDFIKVYFEVNGVQDGAGTWETNFLAPGPGGRLVRTFAEINGATAQTFYGVAATRSTDYFAPNSTVGADNMDTFSAYLDLSGYTDDAHSVTMVINNARFKINDVNSGSGRVFMDNVQVFAVPEPASGVTLLIGAAGLLLKRRRRG